MASAGDPDGGRRPRFGDTGLLVGGPNTGKEGVPGVRPAPAYRDDDRLYGVNEPSIDWNALVAQVLADLGVTP